jgi:hypothetical protein
MRNMSFMLTTDQMYKRIKTVTRRLGWEHAKPGDVVCAVEKGMGLKAGEKVKRIGVVRFVDVRREPLKAMLDDLDYGFAECVKEGFEGHPTLQYPSAFVDFFCRSHRGCTPGSALTRLEFEFVED